MAAFVDRLLLKYSSDLPTTLLADLKETGSNPLKPGEIVIGTRASNNYIYFLDASGNVIQLPKFANPGDIYWSEVDLLVNGEPGNIDKSINNVLIALNTAVLSTTAKFGNYSYYFDGSKYIQFASNAAAVPSNINTTEAWVRLTSLAQNIGIFCHQASSGLTSLELIYDNTAAAFKAVIQTSSGTYTAFSLTGVTVNTWHHVALVRDDTTITVYLDGNAGTPVSVTGNYVATTHWGLGTNKVYGTPKTYMLGYIDDFRVTNDVARYKGNFASPEYPAATSVGSATPLSFQALSDVVLTKVTPGQTLVYNNTNWVNGTPVPSSLGDLPDVALTTLNHGDYLIYNGTSWENAAVETNWFIASDGGDFDTGTVASEGNYILNGGVFM